MNTSQPMEGSARAEMGLGVLVGHDPRGCPPGWVFVLLDTATPEGVREAIEHAKQGRAKRGA